MRLLWTDLNCNILVLLVIVILGWSPTTAAPSVNIQDIIPKYNTEWGFQYKIEANNYYISAILPGSVVSRHDIKPGDKIVGMNGDNLEKVTVKELHDYLKQTVNSLFLTIQRKDEQGVYHEHEVLITLDDLADSRKKKSTQTVYGTGEGAGLHRVVLYMDPPIAKMPLNKTQKFSIILSNSQGVMVDEIRIQLQFNPAYLKLMPLAENKLFIVETTLEKGWSITTNDYSLTEGKLCLQLTHPKPTQYVHGILGTLIVRSLDPVEITKLKFNFGKTKEELYTGVYYRGKDILGSSLDHTDGTIDTDIYIDSK